MMKVMLAAIEIFSLVYQMNFCTKSPDTNESMAECGSVLYGECILLFLIFLLTVLQKVRGTIQEYLLSHFFCFSVFYI